MKNYKIKDVLIFEKKTKNRASKGKERGKYKFFTSSPIQTKFIDCFDFDGRYIILGTGGTANIHYCNEKFSASADCLVATANKQIALTKYIYTYLIGNFDLLKDGFRGAGLKHISKEYINNICIPLPDISKQRQVISIIEKAENLKINRGIANKNPDKIIKSLFFEMFGNEENKWNGFGLAKIKDYATFQGGFAFKSKDYSNDGIPLVKIQNVNYNRLVWSEKTYLPQKYLEKYKDFLLKEQDIVMAMTRPIIKSLNNVKVVKIEKEDLPLLLNQRVGRFLINKEGLNETYLLYFCYMDYFKEEVKKLCSSSLQPNISSKQIESIKIPIPSIELQNKFVSIVKGINLFREKQELSTLEINKIYNTLIEKEVCV